MKNTYLTPLRFAYKDKSHHVFWEFKCNCGNTKIIRFHHYKDYRTKSCGCWKMEKRQPLYGTKFYRAYNAMFQRCENKKNPRYKNYGGRGIKVLWNSFKEFKNDMYESFLEHEKLHGGRNTQIDRINNNGDYCKENCRWATLKEQYKTRRPRCKKLSTSEMIFS